MKDKDCVYKLLLVWRATDENLDGLEKRILALLNAVDREARLDEHNRFFSVMHAERIAELEAKP